jgi:hypothetical protein
VSSRATDYGLLIGELKDTHLTVPEDTSKHEDDFYQIQRSCGTPSPNQPFPDTAPPGIWYRGTNETLTVIAMVNAFLEAVSTNTVSCWISG